MSGFTSVHSRPSVAGIKHIVLDRLRCQTLAQPDQGIPGLLSGPNCTTCADPVHAGGKNTVPCCMTARFSERGRSVPRYAREQW